MPEAVEMHLATPPELGPELEVLAELRDRVQSVEVEHALGRQRTGQRVHGRRAVLAQSWRSHPLTSEPRRKLRPRVATRSKWARIEVLLRNRAFVEAYTTARDAWRDGAIATFPSGTYWPRRFANVAVADAWSVTWAASSEREPRPDNSRHVNSTHVNAREIELEVTQLRTPATGGYGAPPESPLVAWGLPSYVFVTFRGSLCPPVIHSADRLDCLRLRSSMMLIQRAGGVLPAATNVSATLFAIEVAGIKTQCHKSSGTIATDRNAKRAPDSLERRNPSKGSSTNTKCSSKTRNPSEISAQGSIFDSLTTLSK